MTQRHLGFGTFLVIWIFGGFSVAIQARANGELTHHTGNGVQAALISFGSGFIIISIAMIFSKSMHAGLGRIIASLRDRSLPWWALPSGVLGGIFVASQSFTVALIGVAMFSVGIVAGQTLNSLVVDHYGLGPIGRQHITVRRVLSALIAIAAVIVAVSTRLGGGDARYYAIFLAMFAGAAVAVQQALNGRTSAAARQPFSATWVAFGFGTSILLIAAVIGVLFLGAKAQFPTSGPWWMFLGGAMGVTFISTASWGVPRLGVLVFALISIAGQLTAGLTLD
ncbi:MAG: hypothetical protein RL205_371, partial [Actinomycetota bacterium]